MGQSYARLRDTLIDFERHRLFGITENPYPGGTLSSFSSEVQPGGVHNLEMQLENDVMLQLCNFDEPALLWPETSIGWQGGEAGAF